MLFSLMLQRFFARTLLVLMGTILLAEVCFSSSLEVDRWLAFHVRGDFLRYQVLAYRFGGIGSEYGPRVPLRLANGADFDMVIRSPLELCVLMPGVQLRSVPRSDTVLNVYRLSAQHSSAIDWVDASIVPSSRQVERAQIYLPWIPSDGCPPEFYLLPMTLSERLM